MKNDKFRVLVDWDRDGFANAGVPSDTPPNLVPNPYFMLRSYVRGTRITGHEIPNTRPVVVKDLDPNLGFQYAQLAMGGANAKQIFVGGKFAKFAQPLPNDAFNTYGCTQRYFDSGGAGLQERVAQINDELGEWAGYLKGGEVYSGSGIIMRGGFHRSGLPGSYTSITNEFPVQGAVFNAVSVWVKAKSYQNLPAGNVPFILEADFPTGASYPPPTTGNINILTSTFVADNQWHQLTGLFVPSAGRTNVIITLRLNGAFDNGEWWATGMTVYNNSTGSPPFTNYVADPLVRYDQNDFVVLLNANSTYNYSFYAKADTFDNININLWTVDAGTVTWTNRGTVSSQVINSDWQRYAVSFTTGTNSSYAMLIITPKVGVNPASAGVVGNMYVRAFQLTQGTMLYPLHTGTSSNYDDITDYVVDFAYKFGKSSLEEPLPYEGTLDLTINNSSQLFSPANTASPIYGMFNQGCKVILQIKHPTTGVWSNLWAGWLSSLEATAGRNSDRRVKIHCQQGIYRLRNGTFTVDVASNVPFKTMVQNIIKSGSWRSVTNAYEGVLGFNMRVGETFYISDINAAFAALDDGLNNYDLQGLDWGRNTTTYEALADLFNAENASMFLDRDGLLTVRNRNFWVGRKYNPDVTMTLDTNVQVADYGYGEKVINSYEMTYQPAKFNTNQIVWQTKGSLLLSKQSSRSIALVFSLPEGRNKTVANLQSAIQLTLYDKDPNKFPSNPAVVDTTIIAKVSATINKTGSRYFLLLKNSNPTAYYIVAVIMGDQIDTGDQIAGSYQDRASIVSTVSVAFGHASNPVISSVEQAEAVAQFFVSRNSTPIGEFKRIKIVDDDTLDTYNTIMGLRMGSVIQMKEEQTKETNRLSAVVEEAGYYNGGSFAYDVTLDKLDGQGYFKLDVGFVEPSDGAIAAYPVGIKGAAIKDVYDTALNVFVKEMDFGVKEGWVYYIDNPLTVRTWDFNAVNMFAYQNTPIDWLKYGKKPANVFNTTFGAIAPTNTIPNSSVNPSQITFSTPSIEVYATSLPYIRVLPNTYYIWYVNGTNPNGSYPLFSSNFGAPFALLRPFSNVHADKQGATLASDMAGLTWWGLTGSTKVIEGGSAISGMSYTYNGQSENEDHFEYRMYTAGIAGHFRPTTDRFNLNVTQAAVSLANPISGALLYDIGLVAYSNLNNMPVDNTKQYDVFVWLKTAPSSPDFTWSVEVLDSNHVTIGQQSVSPDAKSISRVKISLPPTSNITVKISRVGGNPNGINGKIWVYKVAVEEYQVIGDPYQLYTDIPAPSSLVYI